ncbi:MAG TPA: M1 family aminopeptidase [Acidimicrobiales bacterium]|nr:M1 family aminopeptidase [Acidimicrobiales bacterium]
MRRLLIALLVATACTAGQDPTVAGDERPAATTATSPSASSSTTTPAPTVSTSTTTTVAGLPATATCPAVPPRAGPAPDRPRYQLDLTVDLDANEVGGRLVVRFAPDLPTDRLVFRLWPNGPRLAGAGAHLDVDAVYLGSTVPVATEQPDATTLVVPLDRALAAGESIEATVPFTLTLPGPANDRTSRRGDTVRLGTFHPMLAWEPGVGWATDAATALFAEATMAPVADWSVAIAAPAGLTVIAPGEHRDGRWHATALREFAVAVGRFRVAGGVAGAPHPVPVVVAVEVGLPEDQERYLDTVVRALTDFGARFGPYPYDRFTLVLTPDLGGGIEYPSFVHQGPGTGGRTTPHEVAHQWFYALVGNSQGRDPWLDEGLATWAEARFLGNVATIVATDIPAAGRGRAGEPMAFWDAGRGSAYYRSVYVQGAQALAALGDPEQVDCALRHYVARHAHRVATVADFVEAVSDVFPDAAAVLERFGIASR